MQTSILLIALCLASLGYSQCPSTTDACACEAGFPGCKMCLAFSGSYQCTNNGICNQQISCVDEQCSNAYGNDCAACNANATCAFCSGGNVPSLCLAATTTCPAGGAKVANCTNVACNHGPNDCFGCYAEGCSFCHNTVIGVTGCVGLGKCIGGGNTVITNATCTCNQYNGNCDTCLQHGCFPCKTSPTAETCEATPNGCAGAVLTQSDCDCNQNQDCASCTTASCVPCLSGNVTTCEGSYGKCNSIGGLGETLQQCSCKNYGSDCTSCAAAGCTICADRNTGAPSCGSSCTGGLLQVTPSYCTCRNYDLNCGQCQSNGCSFCQIGASLQICTDNNCPGNIKPCSAEFQCRYLPTQSCDQCVITTINTQSQFATCTYCSGGSLNGDCASSAALCVGGTAITTTQTCPASTNPPPVVSATVLSPQRVIPKSVPWTFPAFSTKTVVSCITMIGIIVMFI